jgi:hypothetical protein
MLIGRRRRASSLRGLGLGPLVLLLAVLATFLGGVMKVGQKWGRSGKPLRTRRLTAPTESEILCQ